MLKDPVMFTLVWGFVFTIGAIVVGAIQVIVGLIIAIRGRSIDHAGALIYVQPKTNQMANDWATTLKSGGVEPDKLIIGSPTSNGTSTISVVKARDFIK
jgi:hypothetical protein